MTHSIGLPYDSETLEIEKVMQKLTLMRGQRIGMQDFVDRAIEMFAKIGFKVEVRTYSTASVEEKGGIEKVEEIPGLYSFDVEIQGRLDRHEFDHDRMAHEVRNNLLEIPGAGGVVTDKGLDEIVRQHTKGHRH